MTVTGPADDDPWVIREEAYDPDDLGRWESLFALANGHLGLRGNLDEGEPRNLSGTYLNGFYESYPLEYGERGFAFAEDGQAVVNVTDGKVMRLLVEDEPLDVERGELLSHRRELDLRTGILTRELEWRSEYGRAIRVRTRRLVSFVWRSVAAIEYTVEPLDDEPVAIALQSNLLANQPASAESADPRSGKSLNAVLEPELSIGHGHRVVLGHTTARTRLSMAAGMDHTIESEQRYEVREHHEEDLGRVTIATKLEAGKPLTMVKVLAYHWSSRQTPAFLRDQVDASLDTALSQGFEGLAASQREYLDAWWAKSDVALEGDPEIQQALHFALFHLLQASVRAEGRAIAAKGLTGSGYDGHAFWDTETFVLAVLSYIAPSVVRDALQWRHSTLDQARDRAKLLGYHGAMMPWRTIHGEECSGYWPAGSAAVHISADVADAVRRYVSVTGDTEFERKYGLELLVETARLWASMGYFDADGKFRIDGVTGPDEYTALVDNNVFTNLMAEANLLAAASAVARHPDRSAELGVGEDEPDVWTRAAENMHVPYDERRGLHPQDQDFLLHEKWDFEGTPPANYPLLLHYPYFELYRKQVVKQADLVLAMQMRGDHFTAEQKRRNFDYYEQLTVRDSSLSAATQSVVAAEVGHLDLAWEYLREAALMDLHDLGRNTDHGIHMASLAGSVIAAVAGLGGFRHRDGQLSFAPRLPRQITRLAFNIHHRDRRLRLDVRHGEATYTLLAGEPMDIEHFGETLHVAKDEPASGPVREVPEQLRPPQPPGRAPGTRRPPPPKDAHG